MSTAPPLVFDSTVFNGGSVLQFSHEEYTPPSSHVVVVDGLIVGLLTVTAIIETPEASGVDVVVDATLNSPPSIEAVALYDPNLYEGQVARFRVNHEHSGLRVHAPSTEVFEQSQPFTKSTECVFEKADTTGSSTSVRQQLGFAINCSVSSTYQKGLSLMAWAASSYQTATQLIASAQEVFQLGASAGTVTELVHQEAIRGRMSRDLLWSPANPLGKLSTSFHQQAGVIAQWCGFEYQIAAYPWYTKQVVVPRPPVTYQGSTTLDLHCLCSRQDGDMVVLNFGNDDCNRIGVAKQRGTYIVLNTLYAKRVIDNRPILATKASFSTDRNSWCWSGSLSIPASELVNALPIGAELPVIEVGMNGAVFRFILEARRRSRSFGSDEYTLTGRSLSALLDEPFSAPRSISQANDATSYQLALDEIARVSEPAFTLNWSLVDPAGWFMPAGAFSYSQQSPIKAMQALIQPAMGCLVSHPSLPTLYAKPMYPFAHWETPPPSTQLHESLLLKEGMNWTSSPSYNAVYVIGEYTALTGRIVRFGTAGDLLAPQMSSPVYTTLDVIREAGKARLSDSGVKITQSFSMPLLPQVGLVLPCDVVSVETSEGTWVGTVDSVSVSASVGIDTTDITMEFAMARQLGEQA